ncbi:helix-turn-helix domain-containing protein [Myroides ceti]|uniref:Helix-turn-helix domain-containing protein n=1 Tax=Paenimyroides ceti TaxID=395087 RepID=A0ABT8CR86_9FLAO|nr:helix-turn-helix domain-containing protein [Paenimyroides ceti]MDN3706107.1 helix-turn-helix domain-containing protein [Paenimyroides ceti]
MIGPKIRKLRNQYGFSQEYLASELSVSQATLSNIESGRTVPDIDLIKKICTVFNIDIYDLVTLEKRIYQENKDNTRNPIGYIEKNIINHFPEKLIEQYEIRIKDLQERIEELKIENKMFKEKLLKQII